MTAIILASRSARRHELLSLLGIPFEVMAPEVQEDAVGGEGADDMALRLARLKAQAVATIEPTKVIVAADTVVLLGDRVMGKPTEAAAASAMLHALRERKHQVMSGLAIYDPSTRSVTDEAVETLVWMREYRDEEIAEYIARGEPFDKAGGYAIQDPIFNPVKRIEGCYANVMGLPLCHLFVSLEKIGIVLPTSPWRACESYTGRPCAVAARVLKEPRD